MTRTTEVSAMNKAEIIAELENMVAARLFSDQPWLADREACVAIERKLIQMGLVEVVTTEPPTWRHTPLGKELDVELFQAFMGHWSEWEVPMIWKSMASSTSQRPTPITKALPRTMRNLF